MIWFVQNTLTLPFRINDEDVIVTHPMHDRPMVEARHVEWSHFRLHYQSIECKRLVLVGLSRMITPSNRCDTVNDFLQTMSPGIEKIIIDTSPFIGEPWRLWFHFSVAYREFLGYTYSYPVEGDWLRWFQREEPHCKFSPDVLGLAVAGRFHTKLPPLNTEFRLVLATDADIEWYGAAKEQRIQAGSGLKSVVNNLLNDCNRRFGLDVGLDSFRDGGLIELPDLGVYRFAVEECNRRMSIHNLFTKP